MTNSQYRWYAFKDASCLLRFCVSIHSSGGVTHGYRCWVKSFNYRPRFICKLVTQWQKKSNSSTHLMLPYFTEAQPSQNFMYTVDHTFSYFNKNSSVHDQSEMIGGRKLYNFCSRCKVLGISPLYHKFA